MFIKRISLVLILLTFSVTAFGQGTGSVKGKVRTKKGEGISEVTVTARLDGENIKSIKTGKGGKFKLSGLQPGKYNLVFEKPGYSGGVLYDVLVKRKKTNNLGGRLVLTVDQGTLVLIEASVFNENGFSVYGAKVVVEVINDDGSAKKVETGYTSRDGEVLFRFPVGAKKYRLTASGKKASATKVVEVFEAAIYRTALTLELTEDQ
ncbi:MAG: carboxypeptidase regulatory-like domain-containing protein [Pyrinomonadaceae bacterium]|nr:carboxypeptidase regulatory-like domain-containing protein [Pyrinomonadaceae bacterium]